MWVPVEVQAAVCVTEPPSNVLGKQRRITLKKQKQNNSNNKTDDSPNPWQPAPKATQEKLSSSHCGQLGSETTDRGRLITL